MPKYLMPDEVERVVGSCDRQTSTGRRDHAILFCLPGSDSVPAKIVALQSINAISYRDAARKAEELGSRAVGHRSGAVQADDPAALAAAVLPCSHRNGSCPALCQSASCGQEIG